MMSWVVYGLATWPCPKLEICRHVCSSHHWPLRWPCKHDERDGPLLIPFGSRFFTASRWGTILRTRKIVRQCCVLFPPVLCSDMERGAQMSVMLCCLPQHKTKEVSPRSAQVPLKKAERSKPLVQSCPLFGKNQTTD